MAAEVVALIRCGICLEKKPQDEIQNLQCKHAFCGQCLSIYTGPLCPAERCEGGRSTDIVVDEMADHDHIPLGTHTLSMLNLEEKLRCDGQKSSNLACGNVARMTLDNCRHSFCYDCLMSRLTKAKLLNIAPTCARVLCANKILKAEVSQLAMCFPPSATVCAHVAALIQDDSPPIVGTKEDVIMDCSIYGKETTSVKRIVIPRACLISDMLSAILQLQKLAKNRTTSSLGIYIRHSSSRYERLRPKLLGRKSVGEMNWPDQMAVVIDVDGTLAKKRS